jgi:RES domain-containing protein
LPTDWRNNPAPESLKEIGSDWIAASRFAVLRVPSVIVQTEWNYLINSSHKDFQQIKIQWDHEFSLDHRLKG